MVDDLKEKIEQEFKRLTDRITNLKTENKGIVKEMHDQKDTITDLKTKVEGARLYKIATNNDSQNYRNSIIKLEQELRDNMFLVTGVKQLKKRLEKLIILAYTDGYGRGHNDTVEGMYIDIYPQDRNTYFTEDVAQWMKEQDD